MGQVWLKLVRKGAGLLHCSEPCERLRILMCFVASVLGKQGGFPGAPWPDNLAHDESSRIVRDLQEGGKCSVSKNTCL